MMRPSLFTLGALVLGVSLRALAQEPPDSEPQPRNDLSELHQRPTAEWSPADGEPAPPGDAHRHVLWLAPLPSAYYAIGYRSPALSLGYAWRVLPKLSLALEGAFALGTEGVCSGADTTQTSCRHFNGFWLALGVPLHGSRRPMHGSFVMPKLVVGRYLFDYTTQSGRGADGTAESVIIDRGSGTATEVSFGLDLGYEFEVGHLYIAPVVGAQLGLCPGCGGRVYAQPLNAADAPWNPVIFSINFTLLRIGWAN